jgi:hypothetical protein
MDWWWNLLTAMDDHEGQAAWAGAIGTILAILASTGIALLVPLHLRNLEGRDIARKAHKNAINVGVLLRGHWGALREMYETKTINDGTPVLMSAQLGGVRAVLAEIPRYLLGPDAMLSVGTFEASIATLEHVIPRLRERQADADAADEEPPWTEIDDHLAEKTKVFETMDAVKIAGIWHVDYRTKAERSRIYVRGATSDSAIS